MRPTPYILTIFLPPEVHFKSSRPEKPKLTIFTALIVFLWNAHVVFWGLLASAKQTDVMEQCLLLSTQNRTPGIVWMRKPRAFFYLNSWRKPLYPAGNLRAFRPVSFASSQHTREKQERKLEVPFAPVRTNQWNKRSLGNFSFTVVSLICKIDSQWTIVRRLFKNMLSTNASKTYFWIRKCTARIRICFIPSKYPNLAFFWWPIISKKKPHQQTWEQASGKYYLT